MKKLKLIGISFLVAGTISFVWAIVVYIQYQIWINEIMKKCGGSCMTPINNTLYYENLGIAIGAILSGVGIVLLTINSKKWHSKEI